MPADRPDEDDVMHECTAVVRRRWHVDGPHYSAVHDHPSERVDPSARIPRRSIYDLRVVAKRHRGCGDHQMLVVAESARTDDPAFPRSATGPDDIERAGTRSDGDARVQAHRRV